MKFLILKSKISRVICLGILFLCGFILNSSFKVDASGIISENYYWIAQGKSVLFAPSSKADTSNQWNSSNSSAVTVDQYGVVYAKNIGKSEITAKDSNGYVSRCTVEVICADPIKISYSSSAVVGINESFEVTAITQKNVNSIKFDVQTSGGRFEQYCSNNYVSGDVKVWKQNIKVGREGVCKIRTYAKADGNWHTRDEGYFEVKIIKFYSKHSSLQNRCVSKGGAEFIASCEGFVNKVYVDVANYLTVGYGKKINPYEQFYNNITKEEGMGTFIKMLNNGYYAKVINESLISKRIKFSQNQFDALLSFSYNLGCGWITGGSDLWNILNNCSSGAKECFATVNSDNGINVREDANIHSRRIGVLRNRETVKVVDTNKKNDKWYKVRTPDGKEGYCYEDYINITYSGGGKSLDNINKDEFIKEFSLYHHASKVCLKGLVIRRFHELDMFLYNSYKKFRSGKYNLGNYPIPECARNIM